MMLLWKNLARRLKPYRAWAAVYIVLCMLSAVLTVASAHIRSEFVNMFLDGRHGAGEILGVLALNLAAVFFIRYGIPALQEYVTGFVSSRIFLDVEREVGRKKCLIPWFYHEDPEMNDKMELAGEASGQVWTCFKETVNSIFVTVGTLGMFSVMRQLGTFYVLLMLLLFVPVVYFSVRAAGSYYDTWRRTAQLRRYCNYERNVCMDREYATERILYGYTPFFLADWREKYRQVRSRSLKEEMKGAGKMQVGGVLFCTYIVLMIFLIVSRVEKNQMTVGAAVSLISIFPSIMNNMIVTLSNGMNQVVRAGHAVEALAELERLEEEEGAFALPQQGADFSEIVFRQVSFRYSDTSKWVLKNVDMRFEKGRQYAIVGENGAGKSTLIKLLLRLYQVTEGEILIDGENINEIPRGRLRGLTAALFQDFQHYCTDIAENIGMGDMNHLHDMSRIVESAEKAGFHERVQAMPEGYGTLLGTMQEKGIDLSGGEWQKLAVSRLLMSPCQIKILDEPTAAMDPMFEYGLYQDFSKIMEGKTTISISHRLASCRSADFIYVLDHGTVAERGTHEALMGNGGLYCRMFTTQKEMYK